MNLTSQENQSVVVDFLTPSDSGPEELPAKKPKRNVSFADIDLIDRSTALSPQRVRVIRHLQPLF